MAKGRILRSDRIVFVEVADDIFAALTPHKGTSWANAGFINKGKGIVVDTMIDLPHARELKQLCMEVSGHAPGYVINTHSDADHYWGNQIFTEADKIGRVEFQYEWKRQDPCETKRWYADMHQGKVIQMAHDAWDHGFDDIYLDMTGIERTIPNILLKGDMDMTQGDTEIQIRYFGISHKDSDILIWLPKQKVMFGGDLIHKQTCVPATLERIENWLKMIDWVISVEPEVIIPGHGTLCSMNDVRSFKLYTESIRDQFLKYYTPDISLLELTKKIDVDVGDYLSYPIPQYIVMTLFGLMNEQGRNLDFVKDNRAVQQQILPYWKEKYGDKLKPWNPYEQKEWKDMMASCYSQTPGVFTY